jgi:hypothetical protein
VAEISIENVELFPSGNSLIQYTWYSLSQTRRFKRFVQENNYNIENIVQWIRLCLPRECPYQVLARLFSFIMHLFKKEFLPDFQVLVECNTYNIHSCVRFITEISRTCKAGGRNIHRKCRIIPIRKLNGMRRQEHTSEYYMCYIRLEPENRVEILF